jgi:hypothetical protein
MEPPGGHDRFVHLASANHRPARMINIACGVAEGETARPERDAARPLPEVDGAAGANKARAAPFHARVKAPGLGIVMSGPFIIARSFPNAAFRQGDNRSLMRE